MFKTSNFINECKKCCIGIENEVIYTMGLNNEETQRPRGLRLHVKAPMINTIDIYGSTINLTNLLKEYNGVIVDFFRGTW